MKSCLLYGKEVTDMLLIVAGLLIVIYGIGQARKDNEENDD